MSERAGPDAVCRAELSAIVCVYTRPMCDFRVHARDAGAGAGAGAGVGVVG